MCPGRGLSLAKKSSRELLGEIAALTQRLTRLGSDLIETSRAMQSAGTAPPEGLSGRISEVHEAFRDLRRRVLQHASTVGAQVPKRADAVAGIADFEPIIRAIVAAEGRRAPAEGGRPAGAEWEAAVQRAVAVLERVLALTHQTEADFGPLRDCHAQAEEIRRSLSTRRGRGVEDIDEAVLPFAHLLGLVSNRDRLDDELWSQLEDAVTQRFGRQLAVAVMRGHVMLAPARVRPAAPPAAPPEPVRRPAPVEPAAPVAVDAAAEARHAPTWAPAFAAPADIPAPAADPRSARVDWWSSASGAWTSWKSTGMAFAHAIRAELARHPYLLSVPLRKSPGYDRSVAAGYFTLLEHVEQQAPGFMRKALDAVEAQSGGDLGERLYAHIVRQGRLPQTYPAFVRDVMVAAIPNPGVWSDGGLTENDQDTVVMTRPGDHVGESLEQTLTLTETKERLSEHRFAITIGALTARFFYIKAGNLKEPRDVDLRVVEGGRGSDAGWLTTLRTGHVVHSEPTRVEVRGAALPGLGRDYNGVWLGVFNPDPETDKRYEVLVNVRPCGWNRQALGGLWPFGRK